jgi:hypothetical protein
MTVERDGTVTWSEDRIFDGIRQDATESERRYRGIRNWNWRNIGALTKDLGFRAIHQTAVSADNPAKAALDCRFNDGTQKLVLAQGISGGASLYVFNTTTNEFGSALSPTLAPVDHPDMIMFANKLYVLDGNELVAMDSAETITTPGESSYSNPSRFGVVYGNRLIVAGNSTYPFTFFPSGIRDATDWDVDNSHDVTGLHGETIECLGLCGPYMIVGGPKFTRAYYLGLETAVDWDWDTVSDYIGPINHASYLSVTRRGHNFGFFMSEEGPMVLHQRQGLPTMFPLWHPLDRMVRGLAHQGMEGLVLGTYDKTTTVYVPEYNEVRFAVCMKEGALDPDEPNALLCVNFDSVMNFISDPTNNYPFWRVRNNDVSRLQAERVFVCRVDPTTGRPSASGMNRAMAAAAGRVYEMDARSQWTDDPNDTPIPAWFRKDGYDGFEDGIREHSKSIRRWHARANESGAYTLYARLYTDGGAIVSETSIDLGTGLSIWSADEADGTWGDGGLWNEGEFVVKRGGFRGVGKKFDLEVYDNGNVEAELQLNSWSLSGMLEDRR